MKIWLSLDSIWTYLIDGVPGCRIWVAEPFLNDRGAWDTLEHQFALNAGDWILGHPNIAEIDNSIMWHFIPELDMREDRGVRFDLVREYCIRAQEGHQCTWKMSVNIAPQDWFRVALEASSAEVWEAGHAQKTFDLPF